MFVKKYGHENDIKDMWRVHNTILVTANQALVEVLLKVYDSSKVLC